MLAPPHGAQHTQSVLPSEYAAWIRTTIESITRAPYARAGELSNSGLVDASHPPDVSHPTCAHQSAVGAPTCVDRSGTRSEEVWQADNELLSRIEARLLTRPWLLRKFREKALDWNRAFNPSDARMGKGLGMRAHGTPWRAKATLKHKGSWGRPTGEEPAVHDAGMPTPATPWRSGPWRPWQTDAGGAAVIGSWGEDDVLMPRSQWEGGAPPWVPGGSAAPLQPPNLAERQAAGGAHSGENPWQPPIQNIFLERRGSLAVAPPAHARDDPLWYTSGARDRDLAEAVEPPETGLFWEQLCRVLSHHVPYNQQHERTAPLAVRAHSPPPVARVRQRLARGERAVAAQPPLRSLEGHAARRAPWKVPVCAHVPGATLPSARGGGGRAGGDGGRQKASVVMHSVHLSLVVAPTAAARDESDGAAVAPSGLSEPSSLTPTPPSSQPASPQTSFRRRAAGVGRALGTNGRPLTAAVAEALRREAYEGRLPTDRAPKSGVPMLAQNVAVHSPHLGRCVEPAQPRQSPITGGHAAFAAAATATAGHAPLAAPGWPLPAPAASAHDSHRCRPGRRPESASPSVREVADRSAPHSGATASPLTLLFEPPVGPSVEPTLRPASARASTRRRPFSAVGLNSPRRPRRLSCTAPSPPLEIAPTRAPVAPPCSAPAVATPCIAPIAPPPSAHARPASAPVAPSSPPQRAPPRARRASDAGALALLDVAATISTTAAMAADLDFDDDDDYCLMLEHA